MSYAATDPKDSQSTLLRVADYLSRPQTFIAVAEARAGLKQTLEQIHSGSVILTTNGEPSAALVPFSTLEEIRQTVMRLLVDAMAVTIARTQTEAYAMPAGEPTNEDEIEAFARQAVRRGRREFSSKSAAKSARRARHP